MKKLLSLFLAALFVFSAATMIVSAAGPKPVERDDQNIVKMDYLDFNAASNALWAKQGEDGKWTCTIEKGNWEYPQDENYKTIAPYMSGSYDSNIEWSFIENGEVLHITMTGEDDQPGIEFILDEAHDGDLPIGTESGTNPKAEYFKIRVRNYSTASRFTFGSAMNHTGGNGSFVSATVSDLKIDANGKEYQSNSGEWQTYIFSMPTINQATNYEDMLPKDSEGNPTSRWGGTLYNLLIFPFGFNVDDGTGGYTGAEIDIDYIVMGSLDYVTNYKSDLELKEESITKLELVKAPNKTTYYVGEALDLEGLELKATYSDGTSEILNSASYSVNLESENAATPVTLTFGSKSVSYNVKVTGVSSIEVTGAPEDTTFEVAEGFSPDGYTIKVNYTDGTSNDKFPVENFKFFLDDSTTGTKTVTANFYGVTTTFDINVVNVTDLELTNDKTYRYNDEVKADDFTINFVYNDGSKVASGDAATTLEYAIEIDRKSAGAVTGTLTATGTGISIVKEFTVNFEMPTALKVVREPSKTSYQPGETFDATGLTVALVYADGKTVNLAEGDFTARANTTQPGDAKVNIKCAIEAFEDLKVEEPITVKVEGEVVPPSSSSSTSATTRPSQGGSSAGINPVVIVVIIVAVLAVAGVVVFIVIKKKKK